MSSTLREKVYEEICAMLDAVCNSPTIYATVDHILALVEAEYNPMCKGEHFDLCLKDMKGYIAERERMREQAVKAMESFVASTKFASEHNEKWQDRAEKAERERDEARATKDMHKERQEEEIELRLKAEGERDDFASDLASLADCINAIARQAGTGEAERALLGPMREAMWRVEYRRLAMMLERDRLQHIIDCANTPRKK